jgi:hypothetical protein
MVKVLNFYESILMSLALGLDQVRARLLSWTMRYRLPRAVYMTRSLRLGAGFFLTAAFYLPLAFQFPALLLVAGPLIFGYPHLAASYRFMRDGEKRSLFSRMSDPQALFLITVAAIGTRLLVEHFKLLPPLPFGFWEIACVSLLVIVWSSITGFANPLKLSVCVGVNAAMMYAAWQEPILFLGGTLLVHNWIAFAYWLIAARGFAEKLSAIAASLFFAVVHVAIFSGWADGWMPLADGGLMMPSSVRATGWYLASWTHDPVVWYRTVVLYTFGLSLHYYVWLKAIPESGMAAPKPNAFRVSLEHLRRDVGDRTLLAFLVIVAVTLGIYAVSTVWGARVYFAAAAMHGWFEISFLLLRSKRMPQ